MHFVIVKVFNSFASLHEWLETRARLVGIAQFLASRKLIWKSILTIFWLRHVLSFLAHCVLEGRCLFLQWTASTMKGCGWNRIVGGDDTVIEWKYTPRISRFYTQQWSWQSTNVPSIEASLDSTSEYEAIKYSLYTNFMMYARSSRTASIAQQIALLLFRAILEFFLFVFYRLGTTKDFESILRLFAPWLMGYY